MNVITVAGQLGRDAEAKTLPNGDRVHSFSVADSQGKQKPTIWWNCSIFGKRGDALAPYLTKGQHVTVTGNVTEREWTDKEGIKRKAQDVRANDVALQGGRPGTAPAKPTDAKPASPEAKGSGFEDMDDDVPW